MKIRTLNELYVEELRDLYSAESQIIKGLPKVASAVENPRLKQALEIHLEETRGQLKRLTIIFEDLKESPSGNLCEATQGLLKEGAEMISETEKGAVRDAAVISCSQRIEHYEMSAYGTARTFAELLGYDDHAKLLQETLHEEGDADRKLNELALESINASALSVGAKK